MSPLVGYKLLKKKEAVSFIFLFLASNIMTNPTVEAFYKYLLTT